MSQLLKYPTTLHHKPIFSSFRISLIITTILFITLSSSNFVSGNESNSPQPSGFVPKLSNYVPSIRKSRSEFAQTYSNDENQMDNNGRSYGSGQIKSSTFTTSSPTGEKLKLLERFPVFKVDFEHIATPGIICMWIIVVGLAKIGFHMTPKLASLCPESVVLMMLGLGIGMIMHFLGIPDEPFTPDLFFLFMLPPIVLDAGYHMPNRLFFDNLRTILLYAVVGTIWNIVAIGLSLYACSRWGAFGEEIPFLDIMLFSSTVSAVDPVAVLAVFEQIHVNEVLYILVFGESLLNDAVTVVLYHMFEGYAEIAHDGGVKNILPRDYLAGFASFFVVAVGGTLMGVIWGFLAAFVSRFTHHVKIIEPIFVFVMAYLSYLSAEMFHLSGILSLTFCGITMKNYVEENITQNSRTTLKYAMKMLANSSEAIIFVFLGVCTVNDKHTWNTPFFVLTIIFCLVYRAIGVIGLTAITNRFRLHPVNPVEQFIMAYGGLRGAVAFALILIVNEQIIPAREMFITTIIAVVYFTVFLQGTTVGLLVKWLKVDKANKYHLSMNERIHTRLMDHTMAGLEDIAGLFVGDFKTRNKFRHYNNRYLRKWLLRDSKETGHFSRKIFETSSRLDLQDAMSMVSRKRMIYTSLNNQQIDRQSILFEGKQGKGVEFSTQTPSPTPNWQNQNGNSNGDGPSNMFSSMQGTVFNSRQLANLFRSYTQSNLSALNKASLAEPFAGTTTDFNNYIDNLTDGELHHILSEAMFKPTKHVKPYTKNDYSEPPPVHPPFQHQMRMQIRRLISQYEKNGGQQDDEQDGRRGSAIGGTSKRKIQAKMITHENSPIRTNSQNEDIELQSRGQTWNKKQSIDTDIPEDDEDGIVFIPKHHDDDDKYSNPELFRRDSPPSVIYNFASSSSSAAKRTPSSSSTHPLDPLAKSNAKPPKNDKNDVVIKFTPDKKSNDNNNNSDNDNDNENGDESSILISKL